MENGASGQPTGGKPKLVWLKVHAFPERNIDPCELRFSDGFNVLLGLNATGKTTLLEIIAAALSFNFSRFKDEAFSIEYEIQFPKGVIHASVRNARSSQQSMPMLRGRPGGESLEYSADLRVTIASPPFEWTIQANASALKVSAVHGASMTAPFPSATVFRSDFLVRALSLMAGTSEIDPFPIFADAALSWSVLQRFDESLGFFGSMTGAAAWIEARRPHGSATETQLNDVGLVPGSLCDEILRQCAERAFSDEGESLSVSHQNLGFLAKVSEILDFKAIRVEVRLQQRKTIVEQDRLRLGDLRFTFERHDGSIITHTELSYGQKRLLALFYYLEMHPHTAIADELVDGLHHRWIADCIDAIDDRQSFLASQNPLILDHLEFASPDQVASTFILCRAERRDGREHLLWSNMSTYDSGRFFRAYQVDVQHVSEILLSKGLW